MKIVIYHYLLNYLLVLSMIFLIMSCRTQPKEKGYEYFPDMAYGEAYEAFDGPQNVHAGLKKKELEKYVFPQGKVSRMPAPGSIPRGFKPHHLSPKSQKDAEWSSKNLKNPIPIGYTVLKRGKQLYKTFCFICHGQIGHSKSKIGMPPLAEKGLSAPDIIFFNTYSSGRLYYTITVGGFGIMPAYGSQISLDDRWKLVHYVKKEFQKNK